jgi:murein DD-endopeptidase MepM/ murein hydrolase activator NlpD
MKEVLGIVLPIMLVLATPRAQGNGSQPDEQGTATVSCYLPFAYGEQHVVYQGNDQAPSHDKPFSRYCFDFSPLSIGSPIHAVASGTVVFVKRDTPGPTGDSRDNNEIAVLHKDGLVAQYSHLRQGGTLVIVGDEVLAGDLLGFSGNTGHSSSPHLCFGLRHQHRLGRSMPCRFGDTPGGGVPDTGDRVVSRNYPTREFLGEFVALEFVAGVAAAANGILALDGHYRKLKRKKWSGAARAKFKRLKKHRPDLRQVCEQERGRVLNALEAQFASKPTLRIDERSMAEARYQRELKKALLAEVAVRSVAPGIASKDAKSLVRAYERARKLCVDPAASKSISKHIALLRERLTK